MLAAERRQRLMEWLQCEGGMRAADAAERLGVSEDTVRRDIRTLSQAGHLRRVHGGALPLAAGYQDFAERERQQPDVKARLARYVADLIEPGQVLTLDGGTSIEAVARALPLSLNATVITHSLPVTLALQGHTGIEVRMPGGSFHRGSRVLTGAETLAGLQSVYADVCLLGVCSVSLEAGLTTPEPREVALKQTMITNARAVVAVVTGEKFGTAAAFRVAGLESVSRIVTDASDCDLVASLLAQGIDVSIVPGEEQ